MQSYLISRHKGTNKMSGNIPEANLEKDKGGLLPVPSELVTRQISPKILLVWFWMTGANFTSQFLIRGLGRCKIEP